MEESPMMTGLQIAQQAKEKLAELTGLTPDTVSSMKRNEEVWHVSVEMIEMKRIPDSADVLATYQCVLDEDGGLVSYERVCRYNRSQVTELEDAS